MGDVGYFQAVSAPSYQVDVSNEALPKYGFQHALTRLAACCRSSYNCLHKSSPDDERRLRTNANPTSLRVVVFEEEGGSFSDAADSHSKATKLRRRPH